MKFKAAIAQLELVDGQIDHNLEVTEEMAQAAAQGGAALLVLPELWLQGYALDQANSLALTEDSVAWGRVGELARRHGLWIAGSLLAHGTAGICNQLVVWSPDGRAVARYNKIHLFSLMSEPHFLIPGNTLVVAKIGPFSVGLAICYDLRFPEQFLQLAGLGAEMIILPAQWPHPRCEHWQRLLPARAIENQVYLLAANRCGRGSGGISYCGRSAALDPWGQVLQEADESQTLLEVELDSERLAQVRRQLPIGNDRRLAGQSWPVQFPG